MLVFLVMFAFSTHDPWDLAMVVAFSALIFVVFGRGIGALRRTWRAHAETTCGFVDLTIVRDPLRRSGGSGRPSAGVRRGASSEASPLATTRRV